MNNCSHHKIKLSKSAFLKKAFIFLLVLFQVFNLPAQPEIDIENVRVYSYEKGLDANDIQSIHQDNEGYIWVATNNGIYRSDGYTFEPFSFVTEEGDSPGNGINYSLSMYIKHIDKWLFLVSSGLFVHSFENGITKHYTSKNSGLKNNYVACVYNDRQGKIWIGTYDGLQSFDPHSEQFVYYPFPEKGVVSSNKLIFSILENKGVLYLGTWENGLWYFDLDQKKFIKSFLEVETIDNDIVPINYIRDIAKDKNRNIWAITFKKGLFQILPNGKFKHFSPDNTHNKISPSVCYQIETDNYGYLWITSEAGIFHFNTTTYQESQIPLMVNNVPLGYKFFHLAFIDNHGDFWGGSRHNGLVHVKNPSKRRLARTFLKGKYINELVELDTNRIFVHSVNEKYIINLNTFDVEKTTFPESINVGRARVVLFDTDVRAWFDGNNKKDYYAYNRNTKLLEEWSFLKDSVLVMKHKDLIEDAFINDNCFFLNEKGVFLKKSGQLFFELIYAFDETNNFRQGSLSVKNGLFVPLNNLLIIVQVANNHDGFILTKHSFNKQIKEIAKIDNILYLSTHESLIEYSIETGTMKEYTVEDGLCNKKINSLVAAENGKLWIATANGLSLFNPESGKFTNFYANDGLQHSRFIRSSSTRLSNGGVALGGINGVDYINKDFELPPEKKYKVVISNVEVFNEPIRDLNFKNTSYPQNIYNDAHIKLPHDKNAVTIEFSALEYKSPDKVRYAYQLVGIDNKWHETNERKANYSYLPHGKYTFKVRAASSRGAWSQSTTLMTIEILPPFWKTWWFKILILTVIGLMIYSLFLLRTRNLERQKRVLEKMVRDRTAELQTQKNEIEQQADNLAEINGLLNERQEEIKLQADQLMTLNATKDKFFSIIAHDLKNPFMGIRGFSDILIRDFDKIDKKKHLEFLQNINESSESASDLLNSLLEWARVQTGKIGSNPENINLKEIIRKNIDLYNSFSMEKNIRVHVSVEETINVYADKNMVNTIIRNLLGNALKYTFENGEIHLNAKKENTHVVIEVKDNGIGMEPSAADKLFRIDQSVSSPGTKGEKGTGLGLILCRDFVQANNGTISVSSEKGKGSSFTVILPAGEGVSLPVPEKEPPKIEEKNNETITENIEKIIDIDKDTVVLIVEDDYKIREAIKDALNPYVQIVEAINGKEGWQYAQSIVPDIIISDVMMPLMDGIELCNKVKTDEKTNHIPFILLTARSESKDKIEGLVTGADDYLTKPFKKDELLVRIGNLVKSRETIRQKFLKEIVVKPTDITVSKSEEEFINKIMQHVEKGISEPDFDVESLVNLMNMSRSLLYKKIKVITGQSVADFLRTMRLKRAAYLIENSDMTISQICYEAGFKDSSNFSKIFKNHFNISPKEYAIKIKNKE